MRSKLAAALAAIALLLGTALLGTPTPAAQADDNYTGTAIAEVQWVQDPPNYPKHTIKVEFIFVYEHCGGCSPQEWALDITDIDLTCTPQDSSVWDNSASNYVNGTRLDWGGKNHSGTYNKQWSASGGGNIHTCGQTAHFQPGGTVTDPLHNLVHMEYVFDTNYQGQPDAHSFFSVTFYGSGGCGAAVESGDGHMLDYDPTSNEQRCFALRVTP